MLAERLHMTVGQLSREMSSRELGLWMEWDRMKPATEDDHRFARVAHEIARILPAFAGTSPPPYESFLPERARSATKITGLGMKHAFIGSCAHLKGLPDGPDR